LTDQIILFIAGKIFCHDITIFHQFDSQLPNIQALMRLISIHSLCLFLIHSFLVEMGKVHRAGPSGSPIYPFTHLPIYFFVLRALLFHRTIASLIVFTKSPVSIRQK
jgi:uncharacterized protein with PQ loop repeat